jgi:hypothetical protein
MEQMVKISIECNPSVFKHGVSIEDIRFAFDNRLFEYPVAGQEDKTCSSDLIDGLPPPLEILYNEIDENTVNVFHAMKCRKAWRVLAKLEKKLWQE